MFLLGCKPEGRNIEQHDIYFGIGNNLHEMIPAIEASWPESGRIHLDAWRTVKETDGYQIKVALKKGLTKQENLQKKLFFINLGGYKPGEFEEFHYKMLVVATDKASAVTASKKTAFYKHTGFKGAESHIDDKYGIDVDDIYEIEDLLPAAYREKYCLDIMKGSGVPEDEWHLGYMPLSKIK
jgi:hypothetical protein